MRTKGIQWDFDAWEDYIYWQTQDKKALRRINQLVKDIQRKTGGYFLAVCFFIVSCKNSVPTRLLCNN